MRLTAAQLHLLKENIEDWIKHKAQLAMEKAEKMNGWDVFMTSRESNKNLLGEDAYTVTARFLDEETALEWGQNVDGDSVKIRKWRDTKFDNIEVPCFIVMVSWNVSNI